MRDSGHNHEAGPVTPGVPTPSLGGLQFPARWRPERLLGFGGQAEVWLAFDQEVGQLVALKIFRPVLAAASLERHRREVRLGRELQHPNLVRIFELIDAGGRLVLAMEWMPGGSLGGKVGRAGPLPAPEVAAVAEQTLAALECLHSHGLVHRDVKPSNLLLDSDGKVRLADLGLVKPLGDEQGLTRTAMAVGSPGYMSPEQIRGQELTPASDLYSLGITLYELLTGDRPFARESEFEEAQAQVKQSPPDPRRLRRDAPRWLARFIMRLLEKRPTDRFADAGAALAAFRRRRGLASPRRRRRIAVAAVALAVLTVAIAVNWRLIRSVSGPPLPAKVESAGNVLRALDANERELWSYSLASPIREVRRGDVDGDGEDDYVATAWTAGTSRAADVPASEVLIAGSRGRLISRVIPERFLARLPANLPRRFWPVARLVSLGLRPGADVFVACLPPDAIGTPVLLFRHDSPEWEPLLVHTGYIHDIVAVPGASPPRIRMLGFNNTFMVHVVGEVELNLNHGKIAEVVPPWLKSAEHGFGSSGRAEWIWYTPLEEYHAVPGPSLEGFAADRDGSTRLAINGNPISLDRWGNPSSGPNQGRDLIALRAFFLRQLVVLREPRHVWARAEFEAWREQTRTGAARLLAERPYRAILATELADALARAGYGDAAIALLTDAAHDVPFEYVSYRLAQLQAVSGDIEKARQLLEPLATGMHATPAADDRAPKLLLRLAVERGDREGWQRQRVATFSLWDPANEELAGITAALTAHAHVWWDQVEEADLGARSWGFAPDGEAVACLARWRLGRTAAADPELMREALLRNGDAAVDYRIAIAAAMLGLKRTSEAVAALEALIPTLEQPARLDFATLEASQLARALLAKARLASGDVARARQEAARLRPTLRPGLLPAILADEVLVAAKNDRYSPGAAVR